MAVQISVSSTGSIAASTSVQRRKLNVQQKSVFCIHSVVHTECRVKLSSTMINISVASLKKVLIPINHLTRIIALLEGPYDMRSNHA